jgi:hypothetical protein
MTRIRNTAQNLDGTFAKLSPVLPEEWPWACPLPPSLPEWVAGRPRPRHRPEPRSAAHPSSLLSASSATAYPHSCPA